MEGHSCPLRTVKALEFTLWELNVSMHASRIKKFEMNSMSVFQLSSIREIGSYSVVK